MSDNLSQGRWPIRRRDFGLRFPGHYFYKIGLAFEERQIAAGSEAESYRCLTAEFFESRTGAVSVPYRRSTSCQRSNYCRAEPAWEAS